MRRPSSRIAAFGAAALVIAVTTIAQAQTYPTKTIRLIAPYPPGGGVDMAARITAQALSEVLGQQVIVDNRGGASGLIGTELAARAPGDGYTLLLGSVAPNAILPASNPKLPYDAARDFTPISVLAETDYVLTVHPSLPVRSVKDLIALARSRPGQIVFASTGALGGPHLAGELFKQLAKVEMLHVPYKGGSAATASILGGETALMFGSAPAVVPHANAGRLRLVASTGPRRSKTLPDLPTVAETLPGHDVTQWYGLLAPAKTSSEIVARLNREIAKVLSEPRYVQQFERLGAVAITSTPSEFAARIRSEIDKWSKVVRNSGLVAE